MGKGRQKDKRKNTGRAGRKQLDKHLIQRQPQAEESGSNQNHVNGNRMAYQSSESGSDMEISCEMSPNLLYRAAWKAQITANQAKENARLIQRKYEDTVDHTLSLEERSPDDAPLRKKRNLTDSHEDEKVVKRLGQKFLITHMLWMQDAVNTFDTPVDNEYSHFCRFEDKASKIQGQLRDIKEILPLCFHSLLGEMWLGQIFRDGWKKDRIGKLTCNPWQVENLHNNHTGEMEVDNIFLNQVLMLENQPFYAMRNNETMDIKWGLDHTTPGMIVASAVLPHWALSPNDSLKEHSADSGIDWHDDFENYLEYLMSGIQKQKSSVLNIFRQWDQVLFPNAKKGFGGRVSKEDREEDEGSNGSAE
ncbi:hypothetical protein SERLA73DRAFT_151192 [Serpula lacrymans var. lacrymans S7.3]|uniref:Uncharacterized protein n=2 Tax=Serpula lacrymans var. lacrymans TaxID=341189 RepID=F8PQL8_SERL3|nr:uncharacterized protein SERLADRAFT_406906 [Serpula lacrymans var. lacrymans S7.9]EGO02266.1 hypothetical protein SERLA73DRAFT_151192 [Serpula lacrymans var. lacrymans S7.3]EGO28010.1 hypothetical protein SERLADRAFT_406906 [Serpula lacrymans var. lacrymans S7.9]